MFCSPWVCNCGHPWAQHYQEVIEAPKSSLLLEAMISQCGSSGSVAAYDSASNMISKNSSIDNSAVEQLLSGGMSDLSEPFRKDGLL